MDNSIKIPGSSTPPNLDNDGGDASKKSPKLSFSRRNKGGSNTPLLTSQQAMESNPRFLVVKKKEGDFTKDSPFVIDKELTSNIGIVKSAKKIRGGLLVETQSDNQSKKLINLKTLIDTEIEVSPHGSLNFVKGVVTCRDLLNCSLEEIVEHLGDQGVTEAKRIMARKDGVLQETSSLILTFQRLSLPERIKAGIYRTLPVRPYIPAPLRCFKCQRFGHTSSRCDREQICICGCSLHEGTPCQTPVICINCKGQHSARSRNCPKFKEESEIQKIKVTQKLSYNEARRIIQGNITPSTVSYAQIAKTPSSNVNVKAIVSELIPEIKKICETLLQNRNKTADIQEQTDFAHPESTSTFLQQKLAAATANAAVQQTSSCPQDKRKRSEALSKSASEVSDADDEGAFSSQTSQGEGGKKKRKPGWPKGRPRKLTSASQSDAGSDSVCID